MTVRPSGGRRHDPARRSYDHLPPYEPPKEATRVPDDALVDVDHPRNRALERDIRHALDYVCVIESSLKEAIDQLHLGMNGHLQAVNPEQDRNTGQTTVIDEENDELGPTVVDPTGEAAIEPDRALVDYDRLCQALPELRRLARIAADVVVTYRAGGRANTRPPKLADDPTACVRHAQFGVYRIAHDDRDPGRNLGYRVPLCQPCQTRTRAAGRLPSDKEMQYEIAHGRFPRLHAAIRI